MRAPFQDGKFPGPVLKPALRAVGLPASEPARDGRPAELGVRLHDLRHTFATTALDDGHDYREVSEWLGHADYATTLRVYAHWIPDTRENNMSARILKIKQGMSRTSTMNYTPTVA